MSTKLDLVKELRSLYSEYGHRNLPMLGEFLAKSIEELQAELKEVKEVGNLNLPRVEDVVEVLHPTTAYLITAKRKSGPSLTKSYGNNDQIFGEHYTPDGGWNGKGGLETTTLRSSHLCLYECREDAEAVMAQISDPEHWYILEVEVGTSLCGLMMGHPTA